MNRALPADEHSHPGDGSDHWTETSYWGWADRESGLSGWIYLYVRPELHVAAVGVWVYGSTAATATWAQPYHRHYFHVPWPTDGDLADVELDAGLRIQMQEPFARHAVGYADGEHIRLDFEFRAHHAALALHPPGSPRGHVDQLLQVRGKLELAGTRHVVDGVAARDRSWGPRGDVGGSWRRHKDDYAWGVDPDGASFLAAVILDEGGAASFTFGHVVLAADAPARAVRAVHREVVQRGRDGLPEVIELELRDEDDRLTRARGEVESAIVLTTFPGIITIASRVRWSAGGRSFLGEDQEKWPAHLLTPTGRSTEGPAGGPGGRWMSTAQ